MRQTSTFDRWQESQSRGTEKREGSDAQHPTEPGTDRVTLRLELSSQQQRVGSHSAAARKVTELLALAGIGVNGSQPWDIQVHDGRFFGRALAEGSIGVGSPIWMAGGTFRH